MSEEHVKFCGTQCTQLSVCKSVCEALVRITHWNPSGATVGLIIKLKYVLPDGSKRGRQVLRRVRYLHHRVLGDYMRYPSRLVFEFLGYLVSHLPQRTISEVFYPDKSKSKRNFHRPKIPLSIIDDFRDLKYC